MCALRVDDELLLAEERILGAYRRKAAATDDPELQAFLLRQVAERERHYRHLEERLRAQAATEEVTRQINDVYR